MDDNQEQNDQDQDQDPNHDPATGLEIFYWKGQLRYRCPMKWESGGHCEYDTHDLNDLRVHVQAPHNYSGQTQESREIVSRIVDSAGKPIVHEIPPEAAGAYFKREDYNK